MSNSYFHYKIEGLWVKDGGRRIEGGRMEDEEWRQRIKVEELSVMDKGSILYLISFFFKSVADKSF